MEFKQNWERILTICNVGGRISGKVKSVVKRYGAFLELEEGLGGMIRVSDISWTRKIVHPSEVLKKGDKAEAVVLEVDKGERRIGLSIKAASYSEEQLRKERKLLDALKPGEDLVALQHAFDTAGEGKQED